jgi:integrase
VRFGASPPKPPTNGLLDPEIAGGIAKLKDVRSHGVRTGNWLNKEQAETILRLPDLSTLKGRRDRALLSVMIGCCLRRSEAATLNVEDIQQRDGRWVIPDAPGKSSRRIRPGCTGMALEGEVIEQPAETE